MYDRANDRLPLESSRKPLIDGELLAKACQKVVQLCAAT